MSDDFLRELEQNIQNGYVRASKHPDLPLIIYNYTQKATYEEKWDRITINCRGLILDDKGKLVVRGPKKFFNRDEKFAPQFDLQKSIITEKLDGYYINIKKNPTYNLVISSRGSFCNKYTQAVEKLITSDIRGQLREDIQYFCELLQTFPEDEGIIVTKYDKPRLVCWGMRDSRGKEIIPTESNCPFEVAKHFTYEESIKYLSQKVEGIVAFNPLTEDRVKIKTNWFLKTHRIISDCTKKRVWEINKNGGKVEDLDIPNEFLDVMKKWELSLQKQVKEEYDKVIQVADKYSKMSNKEIGLSDLDSYLKVQIFNVRNGNNDRIYAKIYQNLKGWN